MFVTQGTLVRLTLKNDITYTGYVFSIVVQLCAEDNNKPHSVIFISQDNLFVEDEGEFDCASVFIENVQKIEILDAATGKTIFPLSVS